MAFTEIKTINGRQYRYRRKSIRKGDKVVHVNVEYLGPVEPVYKTGKPEKTRKSNASIFIRKLTQEEHETLEKLKASRTHFSGISFKTDAGVVEIKKTIMELACIV
ncbi:MAG: hypothetical protein Q7U60_10235 [Candidatus Methanoperedens sp.]|nr:hypothetical protein [Candidatus Methanoperedens sp.]